MIRAHVKTFFDPATSTATHVVSCPVTRKAAVIDSVLDCDPKSGRTSSASADGVLAHIEASGLKVEWHHRRDAVRPPVRRRRALSHRRARLTCHAHARPGLRRVVLVMPGVNDIEFTGMEALTQLANDLDAHGALHLSELKGPVGDRLAAAGLATWLTGQVFRTQHDASVHLDMHAVAPA